MRPHELQGSGFSCTWKYSIWFLSSPLVLKVIEQTSQVESEAPFGWLLWHDSIWCILHQKKGQNDYTIITVTTIIYHHNHHTFEKGRVTALHHPPSSTIINHLTQSPTFIIPHRPSPTIMNHHRPSSTIINHHRPSSTVIHYHGPSQAITHLHNPS